MKNSAVPAALLLLILAACSSMPPTLDLSPPGIARTSSALPMELKAIDVVKDTSVPSGHLRVDQSILLLWKNSIQNAVDQAGLFKDDASTKVGINATVTKFDFNSFGLSNSIDVEAHYELVERSTGRELYKTDVVTSAKCSIGDEPNWAANGRIIWIVNDAVQRNIRTLVENLSSKGIGGIQQGAPGASQAPASPTSVCP